MTRSSLTPAELDRVQRLAELCEMNLSGAADCRAKGMHGAAFCHESLARDYARQAFALSSRVQARPSA